MLILKSRKITITKLAEGIGYDRRSVNYAISREYMDNQTLDDIARYLNVSPEFFTGVYPLMRVKDEYKNGYEFNGEKVVFTDHDPSGYEVPSYGDFNRREAWKSNRDNWNAPYTDFLIRLGMSGMMKQFSDSADRVHFGADFVRDNSDFLIPPIRKATIETVMEVINKSPDYRNWKKYNELPDDFYIPEDFPSIYEIIEPAEDPEGDDDA